MKEEAGTSSFVNLKCLHQASNMLILNSTKINSKFQEQIKKYQKMINYGVLECPCCKSKEYIRWGHYERGVTYFKENKIYSEIVRIQRIRCKSCNKTHALLPFGIVPYKQLTDEVFLSIFIDELEENIWGEDSILYWKKQFRKYHFPYLCSLLQKRNKFQILNQIRNQKEEILIRYIKETKKCFMQIKLGYLGYAPS